MTKRKNKGAKKASRNARRIGRPPKKTAAHRIRHIPVKPAMTLDTTAYQRYHDELADLLEQAHELPRLLPESASKIDLARRKLYQNQFEITLVGEFQGGKSTTFNNFCDGREISPRGRAGGGLKTSGCIIRAQNLADPTEDEHAIVRWRGPDELLMGFADILEAKLVGSDASNLVSSDETKEASALTSSDGRKRIQEAARSQIKQHEADPASFDPEGLGRVDLIRFALIVARFYDDPIIRKLRDRTEFTIGETRSLVTFPEDWEIRWEASGWRPEAFTPEEIAFCFVAAVDCHLHSPNLARLGCAITDCPGLFASAWDTKVAREAINRADAVLYLVSGDRSLGLSDLKCLRTLPLADGMILVGANVRNLSWDNARRVLDSDRALLVSRGLHIESDNVRSFHAAMALFSKHLELGIEKLDSSTLAALKNDLGLAQSADGLAVRQKLAKKLAHWLEAVDPSDDGNDCDVPALDAYEKSQMPALIDQVERFILSTKAGSTLIGNAKRVRSALKETEGSLRRLEENIKRTLAERNQEVELAQKALDDFENRAKNDIKRFGSDAPTRLANSFWVRLDEKKDEFVIDLAKQAGQRIRGEQSKLRKAKTLIDELTSLARERFSVFIGRQGLFWLADIRRRNNEVYQNTVLEPLRKVHAALGSYWKEVQEKRIPTLDDIEIPVLDSVDFGERLELPDSFVDDLGKIAETIRARGF